MAGASFLATSAPVVPGPKAGAPATATVTLEGGLDALSLSFISDGVGTAERLLTEYESDSFLSARSAVHLSRATLFSAIPVFSAIPGADRGRGESIAELDFFNSSGLDWVSTEDGAISKRAVAEAGAWGVDGKGALAVVTGALAEDGMPGCSGRSKSTAPATIMPAANAAHWKPGRKKPASPLPRVFVSKRGARDGLEACGLVSGASRAVASSSGGKER